MLYVSLYYGLPLPKPLPAGRAGLKILPCLRGRWRPKDAGGGKNKEDLSAFDLCPLLS